jgi:tetratricopeptide (TPR) repeat protein
MMHNWQSLMTDPSLEAKPAPERSAILRDYGFLAAVVFAVQLFQLTVLRHDVSVTGPIIDAFDFHREAARIASGVAPPQYPNFHPPYFPWLLSLVYRAFGSRPENGLYFQSLLVLVITWEVYALARLWGDVRSARWIGLAAALYGPLLFLSGQLTSAPLDAATALGALLLATRFDGTASLRTQLLLGGLGGLAIATRGTIAPFVALLVLRPLFTGLAQEERRDRVGAVLAGVALGLVPVALSNGLRSGIYTPVTMNGGINLWLGNNPEWRATTALRPGHAWDYLWSEPARHGAYRLVEQTAYFRNQALAWMARHPLDALAAFVVKFADALSGLEVPRNLDPYGPLAHTPLTSVLLWQLPFLRFPFGLVLPLAVLGLVRLWPRREARLLAAFVVLNAVGIALFLPSGRYRLAIALALLVPAAEGLRALRDLSQGQTILVGAVALWANVMPQLTGPHLEAELPTQRAEAARASGRWADGERELLAILGKNPNDADAWNLLGEIRDSGGDRAGAAAALTKATELAPDYANAWQHLATIHLDEGRKKEAVEELEAALKSDPGQMFASAQLAETAYESGDLARALSAGRQATLVNPDHPRGWLAYGAALRDSGEAARSEPILRKALAMQPKRAVAHYQLAQTLTVLGRKDEAIKEARETIRLSPTHRGARTILAQLGVME